MKTLLLIFHLFFSFICLSQKHTYNALQVSKQNDEDIFYINIQEKIFFQVIDDTHQKEGIITDIQEDSLQIDSTYYITYSEIKSLISQQERKFLTKKHAQILFAGIITTVGGILLINSEGYQINEFAGIIGTCIGVPVLIKGIRFFIKKRTLFMDKWTIEATNLEF